ncbi:hypothetical protein WJ0W_000709 [Paenibacillus melissococcoides]|uniref:Uncharacterized protein n=1 Tax=Paenibacillus melissococcoides TaxID=2912268 RepID=A0ABN8U1K0_9BACL|nr:hypothetical protein WJ0W_000709 [Paenibacillus melissococcoides]
MWSTDSEVALVISRLECASGHTQLKKSCTGRVQFFYHLRDEFPRIAAKLHPFAGFCLKQARKM